MLSNSDCQELAEILINFAEDLPEKYLDKRIKSKIGASHSLITAGVIDGKDRWEEFLERFHYWLHDKNIAIGNPNVTNEK